jgi:transketolase
VGSISSMREHTCREACQLLLEDTRVAIVLGEISLPYFEEGFRDAPDRIINAGIMEQTMIGVAAGFAMEGFHPIVHTIAPFLVERPFEQLKIDFGYQELGGTFISVGASHDYAVEGTTHHSPADVALVSTIPGFEVLVPGTAAEAASLLRATYDNGHPTYLRLSERQNPAEHTVRPGRIEVLRRSPTGPTIIAVGPMLGLVEEAMAGIDATVLYVTTVTPLDSVTLAREAGDQVIIVEPFLQGTMAAAVVDALGSRAVRLTSIGVPKVNLRGYGRREDLEVVAGLDAVSLKRRVQAAADSSGSAT